jgi:hypothetical protein
VARIRGVRTYDEEGGWSAGGKGKWELERVVVVGPVGSKAHQVGLGVLACEGQLDLLSERMLIIPDICKYFPRTSMW